MNYSTISYMLDKCTKCMSCLKACPTGSISMVNNRIRIDNKDCINCGRCVKACHSNGMVAHGSTLDEIRNYEYTVCIVPGALISHCESFEQAQDLFHAIRLLGFDEVVDTTDVDAQIVSELSIMAEDAIGFTYIAPFCPVVNKMVHKKYSVLTENIAPIRYASEIVASQIRKKHPGKNVGIFNLCECEAKLALAKYPYGGDSYEVDHALSISFVFPKIRNNMKKGFDDVSFNRLGLQSCSPTSMIQRDDVLCADSFGKISEILDQSEFGILDRFNLFCLYPCHNGCIGGHLLWGNPYLTRNSIYELTKENEKEMANLPFEELYTEKNNEYELSDIQFMERLTFFNKVNDILEQLPGYDCSACGKQTCRSMAEEIASGRKKLSDCRVIRAMKEKTDDD